MDSKKIAERALEIKAIRLDPKNFFTEWRLYKPIFLDLSNFLGNYNDRSMIINSFIDKLNDNCEGFAAISSYGTSIASSLLEHYKSDFLFLRDKQIGLRSDESGINEFRFIDEESRKKYRLCCVDNIHNLRGKDFILVDDMLATGVAIVRAVSALRIKSINCNKFLCIFDFGYENTKKILSGNNVFNKYEQRLTPSMKVESLFDLDTLLEVAIEKSYIELDEQKDILLWRDDYYNWREVHNLNNKMDSVKPIDH